MQNFDPTIHHRHSIRLKGYDYSQEGLYFVTLCVQDRDCIFGNVVDGKMMLNGAGRIVHNEWLKTAELRKNVQLHNFIVMPNHFHTIIRGYKSAVTRQMNALKISFKWQRDMYEHIIRDYNDYARIDEYILNNPEKWESDKFYNK